MTSSQGGPPACLQANFPTRQVECPQCRRMFEVALRALSTRCPHCGDQMQLEDAVLSGLMAGNVRTLGQVRITRRGAVRGRIECGSLHVQGAMAGAVMVRGTARIEPRAAVHGQLRAGSLIIEAGARLDADLAIGPGRGSAAQA